MRRVLTMYAGARLPDSREVAVADPPRVSRGETVPGIRSRHGARTRCPFACVTRAARARASRGRAGSRGDANRAIARPGCARPCHPAYRAALLLEVVVSLAIFVAAVAMISGQLVAGLQMVVQADEQTRAAQLGDRIMSLVELDPTVIQNLSADGIETGDFGDQYPGWFWRITLEPTEVTGLGQVSVEVLYQESAQRRESIDGARVVRHLHVLKSDPGRIDLEKDFGVSQEQLEQFGALVPIPGFDPHSLSPQELVSLDPAQLMELLPALLPLLQQMRLGGGAGLPGGDGGNLPPALAGLLGGGGKNPFANAGSSGPMSSNFLRDFIRQQSGGKISDEEIDQALGGGRGNRDGGDDQTPDSNGFTRDSLRDMLRGALGDRATDEEIEQALDAYERGQGGGGGGRSGGGGGNFTPMMPGGVRGGRDGAGNRGGGQNIGDLNSNRRNGRGGMGRTN